MNEPNADYPFKPGLEAKSDVVEGAFSDIKQFQNDDRWIVKEYSQVLDFAQAEWQSMYSKDPESAGEPPKMTFERFKSQVKRDEDLINKFGQGLTKFIPEHHLVYGTNDSGRESGFLVMRRVAGEDLEKMASVTQELVDQLEAVITASIEFYRNSNGDPIYKGRFPDLMPLQEDDQLRFGNLMWGSVGDKKGMYLTDTYPLRFYGKAEDLAVDLGTMMEMFELEKGVKFSNGFIDRVVTEVKKVRND